MLSPPTFLAQEKQNTRASHETPAAKKARIEHAASRSVQALCGWNIFQRQSFSGKIIEPGDYKRELKVISAKWKDMQASEREAFEIQAKYENNKRAELAATPLIPKTEANTTEAVRLEEEVGRAGRRKLSARRLVLNEDLRRNHAVWTCKTQLGDCNMTTLV